MIYSVVGVTIMYCNFFKTLVCVIIFRPYQLTFRIKTTYLVYVISFLIGLFSQKKL